MMREVEESAAMADEEQLPDLDKLSEDLGYDFTEDEPDLSQLKETPDDSVTEESMPSFDEIEEELAAIRPHRNTDQTSEQPPDTEYVMEDYTESDADLLEEFDFNKYAVPSDVDSEEEDDGDGEDFDDAEFQEWLAQQEEAEADDAEDDLDTDSDLTSALESTDDDEDQEFEDEEDDEDGGLDADLLAALAATDEEYEDEEDWRPDPSSSIPNIPVVPRHYTPLEDEDEDDEDDDEPYSVGSGGGNNLYYPDTFERDAQEDEQDSQEDEEATPSKTSPANPFEDLKKDGGKEKGESKLSGFKEKFAAFRAQVKAELKGEDAPETSKELAVVEEPEKREIKAAKEPGIFDKVLSPFKKVYASIAGFFFGVIVWILGVLGKLPVVGKYFLKLRDNTKLITVISNIIPVVLLVVFLVWLNSRAVDDETSTDLPDLGSVSFTDFKYEDGVVEGRVTNTGEVIAQVKPVFSVYAMTPGWNPKSWVIPEKQFECVGTTFRVDIDKELVVSAECEEQPSGFQVRVSGVVQ